MRYVVAPGLHVHEADGKLTLITRSVKSTLTGPAEIRSVVEYFATPQTLASFRESFDVPDELVELLIEKQVLVRESELAGYRGSLHAALYEDVSARVPDARLTFLNQGYVDPDRGEDFAWLQPEDSDQRYSANLIRFLLQDTDVTGKAVLDVGCGRGGPCSFVMRNLQPASVCGLDYSRSNVELCARVHRSDHISFVQGDAQHLPFADGAFDVVINVESASCYPDPAAFFREASRVLRPAGRLCYTEAVRPGHLGADQMMTWALQAGFQLVSEREGHRGVARALEEARPLTNRFAATLDGDRAFIDSYLSGDALYEMREPYFTGYARYPLWIFAKP